MGRRARGKDVRALQAYQKPPALLPTTVLPLSPHPLFFLSILLRSCCIPAWEPTEGWGGLKLPETVAGAPTSRRGSWS